MIVNKGVKEMNETKLKVKDLVTIGVFFVIYFGVMFGVGMMGMVPILFLVYPTVLGIVSGVIVLLFMEKVNKPWGLFILGMLSPLLMFVMGHSYVLPALSLVVMLVAEMIRRMGGYKSLKANILAFAVFNMWICNSPMQMIFAKEQYMHHVSMMGEDYVREFTSLVTYTNMAFVYLGAFAGGIIGGFIGKVMLKKHFEKAGIV